MALVLDGEVEGLVPLVEEDVKQDGSEDQPGLQETVLGVLVVAAHHGHLGCPRPLQWALLNVLDVVDLVGLLDGGVGHLGGVQVQITVGRISKYLVADKYLGGEYYDGDGTPTYSDAILEFVPLTEQWKLVDRMMKTRLLHAVTVLSDVSQFCSEKFHTIINTIDYVVTCIMDQCHVSSPFIDNSTLTLCTMTNAVWVYYDVYNNTM